MGTLRLLHGLVDDAGLFPPSWLPMDAALARFRAASHPMLSRRFLLPGDRVEELLAILDGPIDVHLLGDDAVELPADPRITVHAVELRSGTRDDLPCYLEGIAPSQLKGHGMLGKLRCGGLRVPPVEEVAAYVVEAARHSVPFKATAGLHGAVHGWDGPDSHGYLNLVLAVARALHEDDVADVLRCTDAAALAAEARELSDDLVVATRWLLHSYGSCDTAHPIRDAEELGLV